MRITQVIALAASVLLLQGCLFVELTGPVAGAHVSISLVEEPDTPLLDFQMPGQAEIEARYGSETWSQLPDAIKFLFLSNVPVEDMALDEEAMYIVTVTGGVDLDRDRNGQIDDDPVPISGTWHALLQGKDLLGAYGRVSLLSETAYQLVLRQREERPWMPWDSRSAFHYRIDAAELAVEDITGEAVVTDQDLIRWTSARPTLGYYWEISRLDRLAELISEGASETIVANEIYNSVAPRILLDVVNITDPALAACMALRYPSAVFVHDFVSLWCEGWGIQSLEGVSALRYLKSVRMNRNSIEDVSELANLDRVTGLNLYNNNVKDITPLTQMDSLGRLTLDDNQIEVLPDFGDDSKLYYLEIDRNQISEIVPQRGLSKLEELDISRNQVSSLENLGPLPKIDYIIASSNRLTSVEPLRNATTLSRLVVTSNPLNDVTPLAQLPNLLTLSAGYTTFPLEQLLDGFAHLDWLSVRGKGLVNEDLEIVRAKETLEYLNVSSNQLTNFEGLAGYPGLRWLVADGNNINDLSALPSLGFVRTLSLASNDLTTLRPLHDVKELTTLRVQDNPSLPCSEIKELEEARYIRIERDDNC